MEQLDFFNTLEQTKHICPVCGNSFEKTVYNKKYCSNSCNNKKWKKENKQKVNEKQRKRRKENPEETSRKNRDFYQKNREKILKQKKKYSKENRKKIRERYNKYMKENINAKLAMNIRSRIRQAIKNNKKSYDSINLLGGTISETRKYIEKQFKEGMTWENYGRSTWHIDHIIPCASFDLTDPEQQKKCFHYTNLQPLWAKENISKGAKIL